MLRKLGPSIITMLLAFISVNSFGQAKKKAGTAVKKSTSSVGVSAEEIEAGKSLMAKSDCMACHKVDVKLIGPAFQDIAKKYPAKEENYVKLANKVIQGGSGVWGEIPMAPHAAISTADAKKMAKYILSIK
jgi:cytochrome c